MAHFGQAVEQALHYLFRLGAGETGNAEGGLTPSSREIADFYGLSAPVAAKLFTALEKAGIVAASEGREGGFALARPLSEITVLEVTDAIEGRKPLFECRNIRANCTLFDGKPPHWATSGICAIHAVMIAAENRLRAGLGSITLQDIGDQASRTIPQSFRTGSNVWFADRRKLRRKHQRKHPRKHPRKSRASATPPDQDNDNG